MKFEWDEAKRKSNIEKHGIDFVDTSVLFENVTLTIEDDRFDYGEERFVTFEFSKEGSSRSSIRKTRSPSGSFR